MVVGGGGVVNRSRVMRGRVRGGVLSGMLVLVESAAVAVRLRDDDTDDDDDNVGAPSSSTPLLPPLLAEDPLCDDVMAPLSLRMPVSSSASLLLVVLSSSSSSTAIGSPGRRGSLARTDLGAGGMVPRLNTRRWPPTAAAAAAAAEE